MLKKQPHNVTKTKKRSPDVLGAALLVIYQRLELVVMIAVAFSGIQDCFYDTIRHAKADYCQGKPQPPMKYHMTGIPNPFKTKR